MKPRPGTAACILITALLAGGAAAPDPPGREPTWRERQIQRLEAWENRERNRIDFQSQAPSNRSLGPNPRDIVSLGGGAYATVLAGRDEILVHDETGRVGQRLSGPRGTRALARSGNTLYAVGDLSADIVAYARRDGRWEELNRVPVPGAISPVDVAVRDSLVLVADRATETMHSLTLNLEPVLRVDLSGRPDRFFAHASWTGILSVTDHRIELHHPTRSAPQFIDHDAPVWSAAILSEGPGAWLAVGGAENRSLDRSEGFFGFVDSYLTIYWVEPDREPRLMVSMNLSEVGVITPKALTFESTARGPTVNVWGYGGFKMARVSWAGDREPSVETAPWPPGTVSVARTDTGWITANPLLDAWVSGEGDTTRIVPVAEDAVRSRDVILGELLFFTELMAPHNSALGDRSRFTCETCHFEGGTDGRLHFTGRHQVYASTKTLRGLGQNRPYFSRALDPTLAAMVNNEFRVANAGGGGSPWFTLDPTDYPWLRERWGFIHPVGPVDLRRSLMAFLMAFAPEENPYAAGRDSFSPLEAEGASLFRDLCEGCHQARTLADRESTRLPFAAWESALFNGRGVVWARDTYEQTGILPYVHPLGTRVPSLREVRLKSPIFTNGSSPTLEDAVDTGPGHDRNHDLTPREKQALTAFLNLL